MGLAKAVCVVLGLFVALAAGGGMGSSSAAQSRQAASAVTLVCSLSGAPKGKSAFDRNGVCAAFSDQIGSALGAQVVRAARVPIDRQARWVRIDLTVFPPSRIEAALTSRLHTTTTKHPPMGVQVVDKPLTMREIDRLARLVAESLAGQRN